MEEINQKELFEQGKSDLREHWGNLASNFLVGKTIRRVRYLNDRETEDIAWTKNAVVIEFTDGHWIVPMCDDEGNDAGAIWTSSQSEVNVIPSI
jgi:hypothetical protein